MSPLKPWGRREAEKMATSQGNVSPHCFLVMVGVATWRLEIRWEPGFLLKTKRGRDRGRDRLERQK